MKVWKLEATVVLGTGSAVSVLGLFYKPLIYSKTAAASLPWPLLLTVMSLGFALLYVLLKRRPLSTGDGPTAFLALITLCSAGFAGGRRTSMEWSHHFAPERQWEILEIGLQTVGLGVFGLVLMAGFGCALGKRKGPGARAPRGRKGSRL